MAGISEHHLTVLKTARYAALGEESGELQQVGFVCHGYGQTAAGFLESFSALEDRKRLIIAPEGLSRFYLEDDALRHGQGASVGATWMTREDREQEISDYVNYLDVLYARVFKSVNRMGVRVFALGFSQGAATVSRWIGQGTVMVDDLILWGGGIPPDLDLSAKKAQFKRPRLTLVVGNQDPLADAKRVAEKEERLSTCGIDYEMIRFDGGHRLEESILERLIAGDS